MTKKCSKCGTEKPADEFYKDKTRPSGLTCRCRACAVAVSVAWRKANPEKSKAIAAAYRVAHPEKIKAATLKYDYGLTSEAFQVLLLSQQNACGICAEIFLKTPHVDHCHRTGKVRGLLCQACNNLLGGAKDSPENCRRAAEYLEKCR